MRATLATRPLTLRAPIANEEERAHFQHRLALSGFVVFALSFGFYVIALASLAVLSPASVVHYLGHTASKIHLATAAIAGAIWLAVRRGKPSGPLLSSLDIVIAFGVCVGWASMSIAGIAVAQRPEMVALLACTYTLVVRAALIPSTPARTAVLGTASMIPLVFLTMSLYSRPSSAPGTTHYLPPAVDVGIWATLAVAATTVISHTIYGLRQQVRKAMQLGQYLLEEKIGEGGMGVVYRASHAMLRRPTAIKLLSATAGHAVGRFEREVQITARLTHPNTVAIFDYGRTPEGVFYYAMEYLDGISLEDLVAEDGPQPARRVAHVLLQICGALNEAHGAGLVHRDIKPANVMLTERGGLADVVKVLDFGLVKESENTASPALSSVNTIMGTPHYMAPEAILDPATIDARADLYAVGATAYFLVTGENVFTGASLVEICSKHLHEAPRAPSSVRSDVPASLERVILACLAKKTADRPKNASALASMIRDCALGDWTQEEAQQWWEKRTRAQSGAQAKVKPVGSEASAFGKTIAVALDDRAAS